MFVDVLLPLPLTQLLTYAVPEEWRTRIAPGQAVLVEVGKNKKYTGVVISVRTEVPDALSVKEIVALESHSPIVNPIQIRFWEWLSHYYLCSMGEVYKAVLPSGLRSETATSYTPKTDRFVRPAQRQVSEEALLAQLSRAPGQQALLKTFFEATEILPVKEILQKELLQLSGQSAAMLTALIQKGVLEVVDKEVSRLHRTGTSTLPLNALNKPQQKAYEQIRTVFQSNEVCLLFGVTSSGKTEIYTHLIEETLAQGKQVLYLLPEIALTQQLTSRLKRFFGDKLEVYHSKINDNERVEIWNNLLHDAGIRIIVGVRSSVFLPFDNLGLVIVDEEHEPSYKQQDPAPRYHARNAAIMLAQMHQAKTLLGSATPSLESYYNTQTGKYGLVELTQRYENVLLPQIHLVNVKELRRKKQMDGLFSPDLLEKMGNAFARKEQVILFQNRRGFAPMLTCKQCDWTPKCNACDVSLTYHKRINRLVCHYCGLVYRVVTQCDACGSPELTTFGFGTEKVEEEIKQLFPDIVVERLDADTAKTKNRIDSIFTRFDRGEIQVLIGTQMISKGLDFGNVSLVGILNADSLMNMPDFRSYERAFQLIAQVAGRAGRRSKRGEVVLQTAQPENPLIQALEHHDYAAMYNTQMAERQLFHYPPFYRLIQINVKHRKEDTAVQAAALFAELLRKHFGTRVLGPDKPMVAKIQHIFSRKILLKIETSLPLGKTYALLQRIEESVRLQHKSITIQYDVDPV